MARERTSDARFDFRGGVNTAYSEELLDATELRHAQNARLGRTGAARKREGSRRHHGAALGGGAPVLGGCQWDAPGGKQTVALCGGTLYYKAAGDAEYTAGPGGFSTTIAPTFAPHRVGAAIVLYIADGVALRTWDGAALTAVASAPAGARGLQIHKGRGFLLDGTKRLYWSRAADLTKWALPDDGGFADVESYDTEPLVGLTPVGASLALAKEESVARYTGIDSAEIRIDRDTEARGTGVGVLAPGALCPTPLGAFGLSAGGVVLIRESGVDENIGAKIADQLAGAGGRINTAAWRGAVAGYHRGRRELWLFVPGAGETVNGTCWVYALDAECWSGPWRGVAAASLWPYERPDGTLTLLAGGPDGRVRECDVPGLFADDALPDGSGGVPVDLDLILAPLLFGTPARVKKLRGNQHVEADLPAGAVLECGWASDMGSVGAVRVPGQGAGVRDYRYRAAAAGRRLALRFRERTANPCTVAGVLPDAVMGSATGAAGQAPAFADLAALFPATALAALGITDAAAATIDLAP